MTEEPTLLLPMLLAGLDEAWNRLWARLDGLSQAEYRWAPVADCWDLTEHDDGWRADYTRDEPEPGPVTTIAWRTWHIGSTCLSNYISPELGDWPLRAPRDYWQPDVTDGLAELALSYQVFRARVQALGEDGVRRKLGPNWGIYAENNWADLLVHALDELAHHGGEIGLLRDLYLRLAPN